MPRRAPFHAATASRSPHSNCIKNSVTQLYFALVATLCNSDCIGQVVCLVGLIPYTLILSSNHDALLVDCRRGSAAFAQHAVGGGDGDILRILRARCQTDCAAQPKTNHPCHIGMSCFRNRDIRFGNIVLPRIFKD